MRSEDEFLFSHLETRIVLRKSRASPVAAFAKLSGALLSPRMSDWWNPGVRKRMLSDSRLGFITPHYEDSYMKDLSHSRVLQ